MVLGGDGLIYFSEKCVMLYIRWNVMVCLMWKVQHHCKQPRQQAMTSLQAATINTSLGQAQSPSFIPSLV